MRFRRWLRQGLQTRGQHGEKALRWAAEYYEGELRVVAAKVGAIVLEQLGLDVSTTNPATHFVEDLQMRDLEPVEFLLMVEDEFGIEITEEDAEQVSTVGGLIAYVYERSQNHA